ncbi:MAG: hypothetical protein IT536_03065 [Hyphomicrobiales bacterium]|nr:hypothetical protein [Hyphomicrobiales bacterium]
MQRSPLARTLASASLLVFAIWLAAPVRRVLSDSVVPWDSKNQFYAFFRFLAAALADGHLPFWNPYHYGGHPSVADPQSLIFSPLMVLYALLDPAPSLHAFDALVQAHLLIGALALAAIGARARWPVAACVLAAAIFMFGGAAAGRLQHTGIVLSYGLFPLALLLQQLALERGSLILALAFSCVAAALALGRNQVAMLLCFLLAAVAAAEIAGAERPLRTLRQSLPALAVMLIVGVALTAAPMLLTVQFAALSNRPAITLDEAMLGSLHPAALAQLAVANIFGSHRSDYWGPNAATEPLVALTDDSFNYLFVGMAPMVLLIWFGIAGGAFRRGRVLFAAAAALALAYALGRYTPVFGWMFDWLPGVSRFRRPVDASFVLVAMLSLICGALLADYVRDGLPRARALAIATVTIACAAALAAGIAFAARTGHAADALWSVLIGLALAGAVIALLTAARSAWARGMAAVAVTAIAVGELLWWNTAFRLNAEPRRHYAVLERPSGAAAEALALVERAVREQRNGGERPRVEILGLGGAWQNLAMVRGVEAVNGYNPLRIGRYDRLIAPGETNWSLDARRFPASFDGYDSALARTVGLEYVLLGGPIEELPHLPRRPDAQVLRAGPEVWVYRLRKPSPRLSFTRRVQVVDADAVGALALATTSDRVLLDAKTPPLAYYADGEDAGGMARMIRWQPDRIEVEVQSPRGGVLVLHESDYPGWVAEIDGRRVPILRADILFRAVEVPAGDHYVVFRYAPFALENLSDALRIARKGAP